MGDEPRYLYPSLPVDRSIGARVRRAVEAVSRKLDRTVPPVLRIAREIGAATGRSTLVEGIDVVETWVRDGIPPRAFASNLLWAVPSEKRREFLAQSDMDAFYASTIDSKDRALMRDKVAFAERARAAGLPWPETLAVVNRREGPPASGALVVTTKEALVPALKELVRAGDVILKPSCGKQGRGVFHVSRELAAVDADGAPVTLDALVESVFAYRHPAGDFGYVVQRMLEPHPGVVEITGVPALASLRVTTAVSGGAAHTLQAALKIPAPGRFTDNYRNGVTGSTVAGLDPESGRLIDLVGILRSGNRFVCERTSIHPSTGRRVAGRELPGGREAVALAHRAALLHPSTPTLGWDVALTASGCVFLDVNTMWSPSMSQMTWREGLRPKLMRLFPAHFGARAGA